LSRMEFLPANAFHSLTKIPEDDEDMWHVFCCPPPFPLLVTFWWSISHGCIHMTCNWRAKWWEAVSHLSTEVSTIHVVLFTCQLIVFNHSVLWHI
jgi:hypothetical protein